ncbi:MAG: ribose-phosphate pyrophosphokinase [Deferribacteraceae bacterium]|jgi:ribose-phosphate pyrophosphokinase|nr:ribose-phosphate pyrophosphokinase [Deferribacteraceae bacterium]
MDFLVFAGSSNKQLAEGVVSHLGMKLGDSLITKFSDGEIFVRINETVRGRDVFMIQSTNAPAEVHMMELMMMTDALKRASAKSLTAVMPYFGYARQDRSTEPRVPITAKLVANLLVRSGIDRVVTMDLHAGQVQGFFDIPVDNLYFMTVLVDYLKRHYPCVDDTCVVVSPDAGGVARARVLAKHLGCPLAMVDKRRTAPNVAEAMNVIGDVAGKKAIIVDDIIDTAGTLTQAAAAIKKNGAIGVIACASHGVLSGPARERIDNSDLEAVLVSDSIVIPPNVTMSKKIKRLSVSGLLATAIERIYKKESISSLFD